MKKRTGMKKVDKAIKIVNMTWTLAVVAMSIYTIIPKYDKLSVKDTENFAQNFNVK